MRNKRGQVMISVLFAVMIFLMGMLLFNFLKPLVDDARTGLDCSNAAGISDGTKLTCLMVDGVVPYWIIGILSLAGGVLTSKLLI